MEKELDLTYSTKENFEIIKEETKKLFGITDSFPIGNMINLLLLGWFGILPVVAIQIYLSLKHEEFTRPIMSERKFTRNYSYELSLYTNP